MFRDQPEWDLEREAISFLIDLGRERRTPGVSFFFRSGFSLDSQSSRYW
jgi:hypothetical protein